MPATKDYPDQEIFAEGVHHGETWTADDLKMAVENWNKFKAPLPNSNEPYHSPPLWLGHEELTELADKTDLPAFGDVDNLKLAKRADGKMVMLADLVKVQPELASWIDRGMIRKISAEFYRNFHDENGKSHGVVMRRVCALGGTPPEVKSLNSLGISQAPAKRFSDTRQPTFSIVTKFGDTSGSIGITREDMLAMIAEYGMNYDPAWLDSLSDEQVGGLLKTCMDPNASTAMADTKTAAEAKIADKAAADAKADAGMVKFSDLQPLVEKAVTEAMKPALEKLAAANQQAADTLNREQARRVIAFCDQQVDAGRMTPAQRGLAEARLMRADAVNKVHKFGDKPDLLSELDLQLREIESGPIIVKFGDRMPSVKAGVAGVVSDVDDAGAKAKAYAESRNKRNQKQTA